jgi:hypothetical protein
MNNKMFRVEVLFRTLRGLSETITLKNTEGWSECEMRVTG